MITNILISIYKILALKVIVAKIATVVMNKKIIVVMNIRDNIF